MGKRTLLVVRITLNPYIQYAGMMLNLRMLQKLVHIVTKYFTVYFRKVHQTLNIQWHIQAYTWWIDDQENDKWATAGPLEHLPHHSCLTTDRHQRESGVV